jgi:hypothetical protein
MSRRRLIGGARYWANNAALRYFGELKLVCVPFGSEWEVTLSDVYVPPRQSLHPAVSPGIRAELDVDRQQDAAQSAATAATASA